MLIDKEEQIKIFQTGENKTKHLENNLNSYLSMERKNFNLNYSLNYSLNI